jgi:hypothetical protein
MSNGAMPASLCTALVGKNSLGSASLYSNRPPQPLPVNCFGPPPNHQKNYNDSPERIRCDLQGLRFPLQAISLGGRNLTKSLLISQWCDLFAHGETTEHQERDLSLLSCLLSRPSLAPLTALLLYLGNLFPEKIIGRPAAAPPHCPIPVCEPPGPWRQRCCR